MQKIANNKSNEINDYIDSGNYTEALDLIISVLSVLSERRRSSYSEVSIGEVNPVVVFLNCYSFSLHVIYYHYVFDNSCPSFICWPG